MDHKPPPLSGTVSQRQTRVEADVNYLDRNTTGRFGPAHALVSTGMERVSCRLPEFRE